VSLSSANTFPPWLQSLLGRWCFRNAPFPTLQLPDRRLFVNLTAATFQLLPLDQTITILAATTP